MTGRCGLVLLLCLLPVLGRTATLGEEDSMVINRLNATDFEVIEERSFGTAGFWCGAATYTERRQGRSETTPLYVKRPRGPSLTVPGRQGVVFTTDATGLPPADPGRVTLTVERAGATLKSAQARRYCRDAFTRSTK